MFTDMREALCQWRVIHLLGISTLRSRFARSKLGQFWLSVSIFVNICMVGLVWSYIWHIPILEYLPYVGIGQVIYLFASQTINESTSVFPNNSRLYFNQKFPLSLAIFAHIYKNFIIFFHNIPIIIFLFFLSPTAHLNFHPEFIVGFCLSIVFLLFSSYTLALLCVRFRDLIQIVSMIMQSAFLITPVMWDIKIIPERLQVWVYLNPFAALLDIFRAPLLGGEIETWAYIGLLGWDVFFFLAAMALHKMLSKNLVFWM